MVSAARPLLQVRQTAPRLELIWLLGRHSAAVVVVVLVEAGSVSNLLFPLGC